MNKKSATIILGFFGIIVIGAVVYLAMIKRANQPDVSAPADKSTNESKNLENQSSQAINITYLISKENKTKFCNGAVMDSEGYRKTITTEVVSDVSLAGLSQAELAKQVAVLATDGMCQDVLKKTDFTVTNGTVEISPIAGWAGISIAMCACKPQVEVNLLRIPGITQVVWLSN